MGGSRGCAAACALALHRLSGVVPHVVPVPPFVRLFRAGTASTGGGSPDSDRARSEALAPAISPPSHIPDDESGPGPTPHMLPVPKGSPGWPSEGDRLPAVACPPEAPAGRDTGGRPSWSGRGSRRTRVPFA